MCGWLCLHHQYLLSRWLWFRLKFDQFNEQYRSLRFALRSSSCWSRSSGTARRMVCDLLKFGFDLFPIMILVCDCFVLLSGLAMTLGQASVLLHNQFLAWQLVRLNTPSEIFPCWVRWLPLSDVLQIELFCRRQVSCCYWHFYVSAPVSPCRACVVHPAPSRHFRILFRLHHAFFWWEFCSRRARSDEKMPACSQSLLDYRRWH